MPNAPAVPRLTGVEHIGLIVPDLDAAARFFADVLGGEPLYDIGPFDNPDDWFAKHLAVSPTARLHRMRVMRIANGPVLELIELASPPRPASDAASWHIAFYVEDMEAALAALKAHGVEILMGPVSMTRGPSAGLDWLYFKAPWGQQLELVSYPGGLAAYQERGLDVWRPR